MKKTTTKKLKLSRETVGDLASVQGANISRAFTYCDACGPISYLACPPPPPLTTFSCLCPIDQIW